jgi:hypothetical protein
LAIAVKELKPEIQLRHDRIAEHFQPSALGLGIDRRSAGSAELERWRIGLRRALGGFGWRRRFLLERECGAATEQEPGRQAGNGKGPPHGTSPHD